MSDKYEVLAVPRPKHIPNYNMAELFYYCLWKGVKPLEITDEEKAAFIID